MAKHWDIKMKTNDYTVRLMRRGKDKQPDECAAEIEVCGCTATAAEMVAHSTQVARMFMRHVRFDYATTR
jgi:hypothetical protein